LRAATVCLFATRLLGTFKEVGVDEQGRSEQEPLELLGGVLWEAQFVGLGFVVDIAEGLLWNLGDAADEWRVAGRVVGIRRVHPPWDEVASVRAAVALDAAVHAGASAAGGRVDDVDGLVVVIVHLELRDAACVEDVEVG